MANVVSIQKNSISETASPSDPTSRTQGRRRLLKSGTDMERRGVFPSIESTCVPWVLVLFDYGFFIIDHRK